MRYARVIVVIMALIYNSCTLNIVDNAIKTYGKLRLKDIAICFFTILLDIVVYAVLD
jgi:hypothetical protein